MRPASLLLAIMFAARTDAASLSLTEPPVPADYLEVSLSWADGEPASVLGVLTSEPTVAQLAGEPQFWYPREGNSSSAKYRGFLTLHTGVPFNHTRFMNLLFAPELDAAQVAVNVAIGLRMGADHWNYTREITVTGAAGYSRVYATRDVPEPSGAVLACGWALLVIARRRAA